VEERAHKWLLSGVAVAACLVALATALRLVHGLQWPFVDDHFRDIAQAQSALDGHPFQDPFYVGEWLWYNPLVPWLIAAGSRMTGLTPTVFHVQSGPWLNLLGPVAFYLLAVRLTGRGAALVALLLFLFFNASADSSREHATYGPWLFVASFAQGLFYLTMLALCRAREENGLGSAALAGLLAGITFLAHTGPAVLLAIVAALVLRPRALLVCGAVSLAIASPFLYSIVVHYGAHVRNGAPMAGGLWLPASLVRFPQLLADNAFPLLCAFIGMFLVKDRLLKTWLGVSLALLAYGLWGDRLPGLPRLVPNYHFWRSASAAMTIYAGAAICWAVHRAVRARTPVVIAGATVVSMAIVYPAYRERPDSWGRTIALQRGADSAQLTRALRDATGADAVILASNQISLEIAGPAGRKVVALAPLFSNPYVDLEPRTRDRDAMFAALHSGDAARFLTLTRQYGVTHVIAATEEQCRQWNGRPLVMVIREGTRCLFRIAD
jgi:hypothetical protein